MLQTRNHFHGGGEGREGGREELPGRTLGSIRSKEARREGGREGGRTYLEVLQTLDGVRLHGALAWLPARGADLGSKEGGREGGRERGRED